jgi:hypothetical protein
VEVPDLITHAGSVLVCVARYNKTLHAIWRLHYKLQNITYTENAETSEVVCCRLNGASCLFDPQQQSYLPHTKDGQLVKFLHNTN